MPPVDVIILSFCSTPAHFEMNRQCIHSLITSEPTTEFNIVIVESNTNWEALGYRYNFDSVSVVIPGEPFNFNRFLNIGLRNTQNELVVLANNDLKFHQGWLSEMMRVRQRHPRLLSFCPFDRTSRYLRWEDFNDRELIEGYRVPIEFVGWCVVLYRHVFNTTGPFDENFDLYFQDNDFANTLRQHGVPHALIPSSFVEHIGGATTGVVDASKTKKYAVDKRKFTSKWKQSTVDRIMGRIRRWANFF
jgi:GT2 family glycosyltransferase